MALSDKHRGVLRGMTIALLLTLVGVFGAPFVDAMPRAALVHLIWAVSVPLAWTASLPVAAVLFVVGRIAFARGYANGAPARAFGFATTFYPAVLMTLVLLVGKLHGLIVRSRAAA